MRKMQEKSKIYNIQDKAPTPPQIKPYGWQHQFPTQEGSNQTTRFLNAKGHTPSEAKVNHKLPLKAWQIKSSAKLDKRRQLPLKWRTQGFIK
jgi:hypothetical protein